MCANSQAAHDTYMKHDANIPSASAERASGCGTLWSRTPAFGGKKKLGIYITLQKIFLLATCLRVSKNVNCGRDSTGILLYVQEKKPSKDAFAGYERNYITA